MKVSIIIPVYNVEKYLRDCLDSSINQTLDEIEIICINDGSTDNSLSILNEYKEKYSNIKVISQENKGLGLTRNVGIEIATGEYIYFLDSDDYIDLDAMKICYDEAKSNKLDILSFDAECFYDDILESDYSVEIYDRRGLEYLGVIDGREFYIKSYKKTTYYEPVWLNFYNTNFLKENNLIFDDTLHEDCIHTPKSFFKANRVKYINKKLFKRRLRKDSIMTSKITKKRVEGYKNILNYMLSEYNILYNNDFELTNILKKEIHLLMRRFLLYYNNYKEIKLDYDYSVFNFGYYNNIKTEICINSQSLFYNSEDMVFTKEPELRNSKKNKIFFMLMPQHGNLGDQAIAYSTIKFLEKNYPNRDIIKINTLETGKEIENINKYSKLGDFIILHGGSNLGNLYSEEYYRQFIIKNITNLPIISFPQTIYFTEDEAGVREYNKTLDIYNENKNLVLILREEKSYEKAKHSFKNDLLLCPDTVFYLNNKLKPTYNKLKRNQIMTVFRNDIENYYSLEEKDFIVKHLINKYSIFKNDTYVYRPINHIDREEELYDLLNEYYKSKVVITDRLHGMIFSFITKTPCIVLRSLDCKITESYKWIKDINYIKYTDDISIENINNLINELYNIEELDDISFDDYFDNIKDIIDSKIL